MIEPCKEPCAFSLSMGISYFNFHLFKIVRQPRFPSKRRFPLEYENGNAGRRSKIWPRKIKKGSQEEDSVLQAVLLDPPLEPGDHAFGSEVSLGLSAAARTATNWRICCYIYRRPRCSPYS